MRTALLVGVSALSLAIATGVASYTFVLGMGLKAAYPVPLWQWWLYALATPAEWPEQTRHSISLWLKLSGSLGALFGCVPLALYATRSRKPHVRASLWNSSRRPLERGMSDNHGHAAWMDNGELARRFPGPDAYNGGVVVGINYRVDLDTKAGPTFTPNDKSTWGKGATAPVLVDPCDNGAGHSIIFSGPGGYKTMSAVSTLLYWKSSAVVLDPSAELGPMLADEKTRAGQQVIQLANGNGEGFNVLSWINIEDPAAETNVYAVVGWVFGEGSGRTDRLEDNFFRSQGKQLTICLLAHMLWDDNLPAERKTVRTWRAAISLPEPEMKDLLNRIHTGSKSLMAKQIAGTLKGLVPETFSGVYANANQGTAWLSVPAYANMLSDAGFSASDVTDGNTTVFLQIPLKTLQETPGLARVIIGAFINQVIEANGQIGPYDTAGNPAGRVLFLLDEVYQLGHMKALTMARDVGRKYGITLQLLYQSVSQLDLQWTREGRRAWYDAISWRAYGSIKDMDTAEELSKACGHLPVVAISEGTNNGTSARPMEIGSRSKGGNQSWHEISRRLILPEELTQDVRADELFVIASGCKPIRIGRAIYFRRPDMVVKVKKSTLIMQKGAAA